ncbi:MAG: hypothetical protein WBQ75_11920 [Acetobacteraceae bacterium]
MNAAEAQGLYELAEAGRIAARTHQPDVEKPVEARYPDVLAALQWHLDRGEVDAGYRRWSRSGWEPIASQTATLG